MNTCRVTNPLRNLLITALTALALTVPAYAVNWNVNSNGNWNDSGNWTATYPNGVDAAADLDFDITSDRTISLVDAITVGTLNVGDSSGGSRYILVNGGGSLTFDVSAGNAAITQNATSFENRIQADITMNDNLEVTNNDTGHGLIFYNPIDNGGKDIIVDGAGTTRFNGNAAAVISGNGGITKNGSGVLILNANPEPTHTYTGPTTINDGRLMIRAQSKLGSTPITINSGLLDWYWGDTFTRALGAGANQVQVTGGTSGFGMNGNTGLTLRFNNSSGYEVVWGSTHFAPDVLMLNGPTAQVNASLRFNNKLDLNGATRTIQTSVSVTGGSGRAYIDQVIRDSQNAGAGLIKTGNGVLDLTAANTFTGGVEIQDGVVRASNASALGAGGPVSFTGAAATLDLRADVTVSALSGTGSNGTVTIGNTGTRILTVDQAVTTSYGGILEDGTGTLSLVKDGNGSLALSGASTYSGGTTVDGGTLLVNNLAGSATGSGAVTVNNGATLGGTGTIDTGANVTLINGMGTLSPGNSVGSLTINGAGGLTLANQSVSLFEINGTTTPGVDFDVVSGNGVLTYQPGWELVLLLSNPITSPISGSIQLFNFGSYAGAANAPTIMFPGAFAQTYAFDTSSGLFTFTNASIPEPSSFALLALGGIAAYFVRRRRR